VSEERGIAPLPRVERGRLLQLPILPPPFALHQIAEGFVWRDLDSGVTRSTGVPVYLYLAFAWVVLPVLAPLAIMILEPPGRRRRLIGVFVVLGAIAGAYLAAAIVR